MERRPTGRRRPWLPAGRLLLLGALAALLSLQATEARKRDTAPAAAAPAADTPVTSEAEPATVEDVVLHPPEAPVAPPPHRNESWRPPGSLVFHNGGPLSPPAVELASADGKLDLTLTVDAFRQVTY